MKGIVLPEYNSNIIRAMRSLEIKDITIPELSANQVLVKMEGAPCNPSDIAFMRGMYNIIKTVPVVMGFEGCGTVTETGSSERALQLLGKRVSCFTQDNRNGTWAEYSVVDYSQCIPVRSEIPFEQAACMFVNPFTAYAMMETAKKMKVKALVQNAASGQIGRFIQGLAKQNGIEVINIVRREEHVEVLKLHGADYVLCSKDDDFFDRLTTLSHELNATVAFDAAGGEITGQIFNALPAHSRVFLYGGLEGKNIEGVKVMDLIFQNKHISGFNVNDWIANQSMEEFSEASDNIQNLIIDGTLKTRIQGVFEFGDVVAGLRQYIQSMSDGKIIFKP